MYRKWKVVNLGNPDTLMPNPLLTPSHTDRYVSFSCDKSVHALLRIYPERTPDRIARHVDPSYGKLLTHADGVAAWLTKYLEHQFVQCAAVAIDAH
jgi:hypothetical protein